LEHAVPIVAGVVIGAACALLATAPQTHATGMPVAWGVIMPILIAIVLSGIAFCAWASALAVRGRLLSALREE
jgi:hypothetical protein